MGAHLLQLPLEVLLEIIELLHEDYCLAEVDSDPEVINISWLSTEQVEGRRGNPLEALRLTCIYLSNLCTPTLFRSLDVTRLRSGDQEPLFNFISKRGHVVKALSLNMMPDIWSETEAEDLNTRVLDHCDAVRRLTIFHEKDETSEPQQQLFDNIRNLSSLEEIHIIDADEWLDFWDDIPVSDAPNHLAHRLLDVVLDAHASQLRTIVLFGVTPLTIATFEKIQHTTPKLNRLEIIRGLSVHHRESLAAPTAWACAANLQHVSLTRCRGAHAAIFTRQLAAGAIGHLRTLFMSICGARSDDHTLPVLGATKWTIPPLEVLELDHFAAWEMHHFAMIHARKVFLSRVWRMAGMRSAGAAIKAMTDSTTFPGAVELHVTPEWSDQDFDDLRTACFTRGVKVVERDWRFVERDAYTKKRVFPLSL